MSLAKLILTEPFKPTTHLLIHKTPFVIGRSAECDLVLDRTSISKRHNQILFDGEQFLIQDLQSKNGTLVNGEMVKQAKLADHDLISIGGVDLLFRKVEEKQLNADLERNLNRLQSAIKFTKAITARAPSKVLDPLLDEIMNALMQLSQAERGFLLLEDEEGTLQMVRSVNITSADLRSEKFRLSMSAVERAIENKTAVAISNALDDTYFGDQTSVQELELKTLVCVPVMNGEEHVIGILYADSDRKEQEFAQLDVQLLESLAANAAIAIENAGLNQEILKLIGEVSDVLQQVEEKTALDQSLQLSVEKSLHSLSSLKRRRFVKSVTLPPYEGGS
jgi:pSer/pThr/pTyr-binding forkhead associated (FHA) protein